jgi:hypothetical protein
VVECNLAKVDVASSNLVSRSICFVLQQVAHIAQLVERILGKDEVTGSIPVVGSSTNSSTYLFF